MSGNTTHRKTCNRAGFTLIEIIVAVAIVAVMAGAITPLVFRQLVQAREDATVSELNTLADGLVDFYEDTGRLPTEVEGLAALVIDPGISGWQGPYVSADRGDPVAETATDGFNRAYLYDVAPGTNPAAAADAVVASRGSDGALTSGSVGGVWTLAGTGDDLVQPVTIGPIDRGKHRECESELATLAAAAGAFYEDHAVFPTLTSQLAPDYLMAGVGSDAFVDPWNQNYNLISVPRAGTSPDMFWVRSRGPDRQDDAGADDDVDILVSSVPPGRKTSLWKLGIAQSALNSNPALALTGAWTADRAALGLDVAFDSDGWGQNFAVNLASRTVYSVGPDGNPALSTDNLPAGVGP